MRKWACILAITLTLSAVIAGTVGIVYNNGICIGLSIMLLPGIILLLASILTITFANESKYKNLLLKIFKILLIIWAALLIGGILITGLLFVCAAAFVWFLYALLSGTLFEIIATVMTCIAVPSFVLLFFTHILLAGNTHKKKYRLPAIIIAVFDILAGILAVIEDGINASSLYEICLGVLLGLAGILPKANEEEDMDARPKLIAIVILMILMTIAYFTSSL
ncbi:MAG: hypothetical protein HDQ97_13280 [Lachnospiraceae bacterium]|nr:hypothetical protein [Lachnospiraceae bacterium]